MAGEFRELRQSFYRETAFTSEIESAVQAELAPRSAFLGLHLRYTDRSHQTPLDGAIRQALQDLSARSGITDLFIAGDSAAARQRWTDQARDLGLKPWSVEHLVWDRASGGSQQAALVDWRLLTHAKAMVYFLESSFAVEAAVAGGTFETSIALAKSPLDPRTFEASVTCKQRLLIPSATAGSARAEAVLQSRPALTNCTGVLPRTKRIDIPALIRRHRSKDHQPTWQLLLVRFRHRDWCHLIVDAHRAEGEGAVLGPGGVEPGDRAVPEQYYQYRRKTQGNDRRDRAADGDTRCK